MKAATPDALGAHAVILLAVTEKPFQQAVEYTRPRGTIVAIGMPANAFLKAPIFNTVVKMIDIKGSYVGNRQDANEAVDFFARGLIKAPFKTAPLEDLPKVFELMGMSLTDFFFLRGCSHWCRAGQDCRPLCSSDARVKGARSPGMTRRCYKGSEMIPERVFANNKVTRSTREQYGKPWNGRKCMRPTPVDVFCRNPPIHKYKYHRSPTRKTQLTSRPHPQSSFPHPPAQQ